VKKLYILLLFMALFGKALAQPGATPIDVSRFDASLLSRLLLQESNKVRDSLQLSPFADDVVLAKAASHHAAFVTKEGKVTHNQPSDKYKTVKHRTTTMGGGFLTVAENVAMCPVGVPVPSKTQLGQRVVIKTYEALATQLVAQWVQSPAHFKNLSGNFDKMSVQAGADRKTGKVYAVQVFGLMPPTLPIAFMVPRDMYGLSDPGNKVMAKCKSCFEALQAKPADVKMGLIRKEKEIFFVLNDARWVDMLFKGNTDGVAVDIMWRDQFGCQYPAKAGESAMPYRGLLLPPVYRRDLLAYNQASRPGELAVKVGEVPEGMGEQGLEFNLVLINNKSFCQYTAFYDVPGERWSLLDMGLFVDTLTENQTVSRSQLLQKGLKFEIPFPKDKAEFSAKDIKPLYDSLRLNTFSIKSVAIRAYASVEGSTERNERLQQQRAESIVKALQEFQIGAIGKDIQTSENWVEFLEEVGGTRYAYLKDKSKLEIKAALEDKQVSDALEPMLSKHRKAIVYVQLEERQDATYTTPAQLRKLFGQAIAKGDRKEAIELQQIVFSNIRNNRLPASFIDSLEIPEQAEWGPLLSSAEVFRYSMYPDILESAIVRMQRLAEMLPNNPQVHYNLCALKLKAWQLQPDSAQATSLWNEIAALERRGIDGNLLKRMKINYAIVNSAILVHQKNYSEKDKWVRYIYQNYKSLSLTDNDAVRLARYFTEYSQYRWSIDLLTPMAKRIDVSEDLLFYYLNLTIINDQLTNKSDYRTILLNAINVNQPRYCGLFGTYNEGGITFQLLGNPYLKRTYCENCN
jgi:uncharacterized protein YkwD